jgi:hypothetical protein
MTLLLLRRLRERVRNQDAHIGAASYSAALLSSFIWGGGLSLTARSTGQEEDEAPEIGFIYSSPPPTPRVQVPFTNHYHTWIHHIRTPRIFILFPGRLSPDSLTRHHRRPRGLVLFPGRLSPNSRTRHHRRPDSRCLSLIIIIRGFIILFRVQS